MYCQPVLFNFSIVMLNLLRFCDIQGFHVKLKKMAPSGSGNRKEILKKEDILQAVVISDSFDTSFGVLEDDLPPILLPLVNKPMLEYTLEFLYSSEVQNVILFCCTHVSKVKEYIRNSKWSLESTKMTISIIASENCMSLGDALRDIYDKRLLSDDFILLTGDVVSNMQLKTVMELHKERRKKEKNAIMTSVYKRITPTSQVDDNSLVMVYDESTNRIFYNQRFGKQQKVSLPQEVFLGQDAVTVTRDLEECQISFCSPEVLSLFADNFDYQTVSDFVKGILENEEILGNTIYLHILIDYYAAHVSNLRLYADVSKDLICRWAYPVVPDLFFKDNEKQYTHQRHNIYRHKDARKCKLVEDVVIGSKSKVGANTTISHSVIGSNCEIGSNVILKNAFIWDNVKIHDNCKIEYALLANNVEVKNGAKIFNSVLPNNVKVEPDCELKAAVFPSASSSADDFDNGDSDSEDEEKICDPWGLAIRSEEEYLSSEFNSDDEDAPDGGIGHLDDTNLFYHEVLDTLFRGIEEKLKCDNLILEINSLKYAYNMTVTEVNIFLTKAVLEIPAKCGKNVSASADLLTELRGTFVRFMDVFRNYIKSQEAQIDILNSMKEYAINSKSFSSVIVKLIHFLYDQDLLEEDSIATWYEELDVNDNQEKILKEQVKPLVEWLQDAEEESE